MPVAAAVAVAVLALWLGRPTGICLAGALLAAALATQAWAGLAPLPPHQFQGTVRLVSDPERAFGAWRADVRTDEGRMELWARGAPGARLGRMAAGQRLSLLGRVEPLTQPEWGVSRHVRARLTAVTVDGTDDGGPLVRAVNAARDVVVRGAAVIPHEPRSLFLGFVLGDDRGGSPQVADDFDGSGLTHLLVVSGQNVAFLLAVASPVLSRLGRRSRFAGAILVLGAFAAVTRFEPSVLRATAMAGIAALAALLGRPAAGRRTLALAVAGLVLIDPLLVHSVGFRLSVAASAGILLLAVPVADALPLPGWLARPLGVTLAAQGAVAPLLVPVFGGMPVAAVPANLLAEPVAGLVMMWGCSAGVVAGLLGGPVAAVVHLPTRAGLWWVATVARVGAALPLGRLGLAGVAAVGGAGALCVLGRRVGSRSLVVAAATAMAVVLALPGLDQAQGPGVVGSREIGGATLWRGGGPAPAVVLVVPGDARAEGVLSGLRDVGVRRVDLVVLRSAGPKAAEVLAVVRSRVSVDVVWAPTGSPAPDVAAAPKEAVVGGGLAVAVAARSDGLDVEVALQPGAVGGGG